jgi:hypothetical protein
VGLSVAAWYRPPLDWTVRDAEVIAELSKLVHIEIDASINSQRLIRVFKQLKQERGLPRVVATTVRSFWAKPSFSG